MLVGVHGFAGSTPAPVGNFRESLTFDCRQYWMGLRRMQEELHTLSIPVRVRGVRRSLQETGR